MTKHSCFALRAGLCVCYSSTLTIKILKLLDYNTCMGCIVLFLYSFEITRADIIQWIIKCCLIYQLNILWTEFSHSVDYLCMIVNCDYLIKPCPQISCMINEMVLFSFYRTFYDRQIVGYKNTELVKAFGNHYSFHLMKMPFVS